ncbi:MAG: MBL fold metallo-hydrolase [Chitinophagales bacterium]|nr:MBL fold metallo-hydrolase [Chitinophagales bacterium]
MEIEFVNHASFIVKTKSGQFICDPWLEGTAFDNGWKLLSQTKFPYENFRNITHIWFSHEHPDHFAPGNILKIPTEYRANITVLYQKTIDRKVSNFCKHAGFKEIIEMESNKYFLLGEMKLMCNAYTDGDSYLHLIVDGISILNLNDCMVDSNAKAKSILKAVGKVDVLFTQFGYANKVGNMDEVELRKISSNEKLNRIKLQCEIFKPKFVVPFASFVWFCHQENFYMNEGMNRIDEVQTFISKNISTKPIILYPGDCWNVKEELNNAAAIKKYSDDYKIVSEKNVIQSVFVSKEQLINNAEIFLKKIKERNSNSLNTILKWETDINVSDLSECFALGVKHGFKATPISENECDISLSSAALNYVFKNDWGGDSLNVNARFQIPSNGNYFHFKRFSHVASLNNRGEEYVEQTFFQKLLSKILS